MIPVRFAIDDDLWQSFTVEQVTKQIRRLRETGRFWSPNHGSPFVVRVSQYALMGDTEARDMLVKQGHPNVSRTKDKQCFYDFHFEGDDDALTDITVVTRGQEIGSLHWTPQERQEFERLVAEALSKEEIIQIWWEKDYVCTRVKVPQDEWQEIDNMMAANVVVILLQDRTANKIEIEPKKKPKLRLNFIQRRPTIPDNENLPEIVLTIPRRVYKTTGTGKPHAPARMHYRAEHIRRQQFGPRSDPSYREIVIVGTWINAKDGEDLGTPITFRKYKFKAVREKEQLHTNE